MRRSVEQDYEFRDELGSRHKTYQTNALSNRLRKGMKDIDGRVKPLGKPFVAGLRLIRPLALLLKYGKNRTRGLAGLELRHEWMGKQVVFCAPFVGFQGVVKNELKGVGRGDRMVRLRHETM